MRWKAEGSRIAKLIFYVDTSFGSGRHFISAIGVEFTDGTTDFTGGIRDPKKTKVQIVQPGHLTGTIRVKLREEGVHFHVGEFSSKVMEFTSQKRTMRTGRMRERTSFMTWINAS